jgi:hypothetical protein
MLTLGTLRLGLIVVAAIAGMVGIYFVFDAVGDLREAQVWAKINKAIAVTNQATGAENEKDEETLALAEKLRGTALAAAKRMQGGKCPLTAEEATALGRIQ